MFNIKTIVVSRMMSHCAGTVQMREESESGIAATAADVYSVVAIEAK